MNESLKLLSDLTFYMKYSKYVPEKKRRETWEETVLRNRDMHISKYPQIKGIIEKAYSLVLAKKILPSMRSMQFGGEPILKNNARMYNCSAIGLDNISAFSDLFYLLLCGCGVGFSVRKNFISKLPKLAKRSGKKIRFTPEDSIEGWADCSRELLKAYFETGNDIEFDLSTIRPKGALIKSSMTAAPGPEPLRDSLNKIKFILDKKLARAESSLSSIEAYDICCHLSESVLAGGVRRSSMICLFDKTDEEMLHAKEGAYWDHNPQRALSNNSVQFDRDTTTRAEFDKVFKQCQASGCGEPGFIWTNSDEWMVNPCAEISFPSYGFCNLTSTNVGDVLTQKDLEERVYYSSVIGTLQAGYTDFKYIDPNWKTTAEDMALIGVSLTGIAAHSDLTKFDFKKAAESVKKANEDIAKKIGIRTADRLTTIKPEGTGSLVLGTSSGIHPWHADHYIRRLRVNKLEPLYAYLRDNFPDMIEDDKRNPDKGAIISMVIEAPKDAVTRSDQTAVEFLDRVKYMYENWVVPGHVKGENTNNVSCTCNIKENEWDAVCEWMWKNRDSYTGISLLPFSDAIYEQAPFEEADAEIYNKFASKHRELHLEKIEEEKNFVNFQSEAACAGGACEVF